MWACNCNFYFWTIFIGFLLVSFTTLTGVLFWPPFACLSVCEHGRRNRVSRVSDCSPTFEALEQSTAPERRISHLKFQKNFPGLYPRLPDPRDLLLHTCEPWAFRMHHKSTMRHFRVKNPKFLWGEGTPPISYYFQCPSVNIITQNVVNVHEIWA